MTFIFFYKKHSSLDLGKLYLFFIDSIWFYGVPRGQMVYVSNHKCKRLVFIFVVVFANFFKATIVSFFFYGFNHERIVILLYSFLRIVFDLIILYSFKKNCIAFNDSHYFINK